MPLSLSDDEYAAILAVAGPIYPMQRDDFCADSNLLSI
jgi:hypothetical protein